MTNPSLSALQVGRSSGEAGAWRVVFEVRNAGDEPTELLEAWLPHGRFRADAVPLSEQPLLASGASTQLAFTVWFDEPSGELVENAFVILRVLWRGQEWRVLTRLAVTSEADGSPLAATELITFHPVGFSR